MWSMYVCVCVWNFLKLILWKRKQWRKEECKLQRKAWGDSQSFSTESSVGPCLAPTVNSPHEVTSCLGSWWHSFLMADKWLFPFAISLWMCVYKKVIASWPDNVGWGIFWGVSIWYVWWHSCLFLPCRTSLHKFQGLRMPYLLLEWIVKRNDQSPLELEWRHLKSTVRRIDDGLMRLLEQHLWGF